VGIESVPERPRRVGMGLPCFGNCAPPLDELVRHVTVTTQKDKQAMAFIYYVTQIQFEFGAIKLLRQECERVGITRPLIVTDPGVKAAGIFQKALDALNPPNTSGASMTVAVFDQTPSNPTEAAVRAAAALYKASGCDGLIAVGGGSAIDCAKGVAIAATHEGPLKTYATIEGGSPKITDRVAPRDGRDREARLNMMSASMQGALAFQKGLGCVHSLSHSLGGVDPRLHHGTLNAMFLPAVVRFNAQAESVQKEHRLDRMARAMGLASGSDIPEAIKDMNARLGLPTGLAAMGVQQGQFEPIIEGALADHCHKTNPRLASVQDYEKMLEESM
jgi:alcohol dehydrogenase class IV